MKHKIKNIASYFLFTLLLAGCGGSSTPSIELQLENTNAFPIQGYPIKIETTKFKFPHAGELFPLLLSEQGDTLTVQVEDTDADGKWDELFFVVDMDAHEQKHYQIKWLEDPLTFPYQTRIRHGVRESLNDTVKRSDRGVFLPQQLPLTTGFQPFQTDGPSWENDKVGFRHYLDGRNSKDVFGKRTANLSPRNVGINAEGVTEDNYHVMEDWGRDILAVGNSLGLGGVSLLVGEELHRMGSVEGDTLGPIDKTTFHIRREGPLHAIMDFDYKKWQLTNGRSYDARETVEIWPGMYGYKNTIVYQGLQGDEQIVIGLVNSRTDKPLKEIVLDEDWVVLYTHDLQTYEKEWYLGLALVLPRKVYNGFMEAPAKGRIATTYLAKIAATDNTPVSYYALACWELRDSGFKNEQYFEAYLQQFVKQLSSDVTLTINEK